LREENQSKKKRLTAMLGLVPQHVFQYDLADYSPVVPGPSAFIFDRFWLV
jgi:hypothetical protein